MDVHGDGYKGCSRCLVITPHAASVRTPVTVDIKFQRLKRETTDVNPLLSITIFDYDEKISIRLDGSASLGG